MTLRIGTFTGPVLLAIGAAFLIAQVGVRPAVGLANNGDFAKLAGPLRLGPETGTWESHQYDSFIYEYVWANRYTYQREFSKAEFLSSEYFFVKLARGVQKIFRPGPRFDIRWLGAVNGACLFLAVALWIYAIPPPWRLPGGALVILIWTDVAYVQYLNTFYMDTAALTSLVLCVAAGLHMIENRRSRGFPVLMILAAIVFATSKSQHAFAAFLLVPLFVALAFWSDSRAARVALLAGSAMIVAGGVVVLEHFTSSSRNAIVYNVVFMRITPASAKPLDALEEIGLGRNELKLVGTYNYLHDSPMQDPEWAREFGTRCNFGLVFGYFVRHPAVTARLLYREISQSAPHLEPWGNLSAEDGPTAAHGEPPTRATHFAYWSALRAYLLRHAPWHAVLLALVSIAGSLWLLWRPADSASRALAGLMLSVQLVACAEYASAILGDGLETDRHLVLYHVATDLSILLLPALIWRIAAQRVPGGLTPASASVARAIAPEANVPH